MHVPKNKVNLFITEYFKVSRLHKMMYTSRYHDIINKIIYIRREIKEKFWEEGNHILTYYSHIAILIYSPLFRIRMQFVFQTFKKAIACLEHFFIKILNVSLLRKNNWHSSLLQHFLKTKNAYFSQKFGKT